VSAKDTVETLMFGMSPAEWTYVSGLIEGIGDMSWLAVSLMGAYYLFTLLMPYVVGITIVVLIYRTLARMIRACVSVGFLKEVASDPRTSIRGTGLYGKEGDDLAKTKAYILELINAEHARNLGHN
jgi:hypothetical protein